MAQSMQGLSDMLSGVTRVQSPEEETKGVLLDEEGVVSKKGGHIFTSTQAYNTAATFTAAAAKANRVQPDLSSQVTCSPFICHTAREE